MAEKGFGAKEINLIGSSGTPTIESPGNLNLNANNVAISTNVSIGGTLSVTGNISVGGTLTYEDVTNIDSVGLITARSGLVSPFADIDDFLDVGSNIQLGNAGVITATTFSGSATAVRVIAANSVAATVYPTFAGSGATQAGDLNIKTDNSLTYNSLSGELTAVKFTGDGSSLTGIAVTEAPVVDYTITGDGSNYYFHGGGVDGSAGDPDLYLIRGQKYRFNNTTGSGHPFRFTSTGNANAAYSKGVTGSENGIQFWTIPYDAPAKLFYVCTIHSGMVGNIYIRGANGQNDNVGLTTFKDNVSIVKSSPILELSTNTAGNDASIRLHESTPGSTSNGGGMFYSGADNKLHITCGTTLTSKRITILRDDGKVGIGTDNPTTALEVKGDITVSNSNNQGDIFFGEHGDVADSKALIRMDQISSTAGELQFHTEGGGTLTKRLVIDSDGYVTKPTNLCLQYTRSSSNVTSGTVIYNTEVFDVGNSDAYNTSNGEFTAPVTGIYRIQFEHFASGTGRATANIEKSTNGGSSWSVIKIGMRVYSVSASDNWSSVPTIYYAQLNANDKFRITHREGTIHLNTPWNHLTVQLVQ